VAGFWGGERFWDLRLTDQATLTLNVGMGAGQAKVDLRGLKVTNLVVQIGAGQATVTLPAGGRLGEAIIRVPRGTAFRVVSKTAMGTTRLPSGESRFGSSTVTSLGFETAADRIDVDVSCAMGSVVVQEY
jgi:hypothetical protein